MKQNVSIDQLNELSPKAKDKLRAWWKPMSGDLIVWFNEDGTSEDEIDVIGSTDLVNEDVCLPLLSLGQMIEFLGQATESVHWTKVEAQKQDFAPYIDDRYDNTIHHADYGHYAIGWDGDELCDALWEAVKEDLELSND